MAPPLPAAPRRTEATRRSASSSSPSPFKESNRGSLNQRQIRRFLLRLRRDNPQFRPPPTSTNPSEHVHTFQELDAGDAPATPLDSVSPPLASPRSAATPTPVSPSSFALNRWIDVGPDLPPAMAAVLQTRPSLCWVKLPQVFLLTRSELQRSDLLMGFDPDPSGANVAGQRARLHLLTSPAHQHHLRRRGR
ncbi:uncharacterized protein LOC124697416 [Lolium rigidum]|uniref:uncharacterized protein LOC124697416 n=1 Tax=Lolium rigidum TaxID=89674 RepID=UPI001F5D5D26|nr:uncharacterized protein LOC124697416 [Lolium rigidum]